jgi:biotin-(acetyl-CoA carboxylase) ligase
MGNQVNVKIGVGLNLNNAHPTECLNKVLREANLTEWSNEIFIAKFMNHFEENLKTLAKPNEKSLKNFISLLEKHWLHT